MEVMGPYCIDMVRSLPALHFASMIASCMQEKRKGVSEVYMRRNQLKFSATENETADDAII